MKLTKLFATPTLAAVCIALLAPTLGCARNEKPVVIEKTQVIERPAPVVKEETVIIKER